MFTGDGSREFLWTFTRPTSANTCSLGDSGEHFVQIASVLKTYLFILRERERERPREQGRGRERKRERIPSRFHTVSPEPDTGFKLTNRET